MTASWDIGKYRHPWDSDEQWELRQRFMEFYQENIPEVKLVCLAQVFANVQLLGCRYPMEVMKKVNDLAEQIPEISKRASELKTQKSQNMNFVKESNVPGKRKHDGSNTSTIAKSQLVDSETSEIKTSTACGKNSKKKKKKNKKKNTINSDIIGNSANSNNSVQKSLSDFLIIEYSANNNASTVLHHSANFNKFPLTYDYESSNSSDGTPCYCCTLNIGNNIITKAVGSSKAEVKIAVSTSALEILKTQSFTLKVINSTTASVFRNDVDKSDCDKKRCPDTYDPISDNNVGRRLMNLMGWSGGGLGKTSSGIIEPIHVNSSEGRSGFGAQNRALSKTFNANVNKILGNYVRSNSWDQLVFSPEFSKEERKQIHILATKFKLKGSSTGKDDKRFLRVSKYCSPKDLFHYILDNGGLTNQYELIPPKASI